MKACALKLYFSWLFLRQHWQGMWHWAQITCDLVEKGMMMEETAGVFTLDLDLTTVYESKSICSSPFSVTGTHGRYMAQRLAACLYHDTQERILSWQVEYDCPSQSIFYIHSPLWKTSVKKEVQHWLAGLLDLSWTGVTVANLSQVWMGSSTTIIGDKRGCKNWQSRCHWKRTWCIAWAASTWLTSKLCSGRVEKIRCNKRLENSSAGPNKRKEKLNAGHWRHSKNTIPQGIASWKYKVAKAAANNSKQLGNNSTIQFALRKDFKKGSRNQRSQNTTLHKSTPNISMNLPGAGAHQESVFTNSS